MQPAMFHALTAAEGEIKQASYGLKCSALFTRQSTPSPVWYPPGAVPGPNDNTDEDPEELIEVEEGRGSEKEKEKQSKQNVRAKEETLKESKPWEAGGREVRGEPAKKKDDLHISSLTISECIVSKPPAPTPSLGVFISLHVVGATTHIHIAGLLLYKIVSGTDLVQSQSPA